MFIFLKIVKIVDIGKPANNLEEPNEFTTDDEDENDQENNFASLFKRKSNSKSCTNGKVAKNSSWSAGSTRMLQLTLSDGHQQCLAIEYQAIHLLNPGLVGAKCLLVGPFDVYLGIIFLKHQNLVIVSARNSVQGPQQAAVLTERSNFELNNNNIANSSNQPKNSASVFSPTELMEIFNDSFEFDDQIDTDDLL